MKLLFVTYGRLSVSGGNSRSGSILLALADAGYKVDLIASKISIPEHPHIQIICGDQDKPVAPSIIRLRTLKATGKNVYDAVHAVDDAVLFVSRLCRIRKTKFVYDARRRFSGKNCDSPSFWWKLMPEKAWKREKKILQRSSVIMTPCIRLTEELQGMTTEIPVQQVENVPLQSLVVRKEATDRVSLIKRFGNEPSVIVVCCVLPGNRSELNKVFMAARKVIDSLPQTGFFFTGLTETDAEQVAVNLDIRNKCVFLDPSETETLLNALDIANAAWLVPEPGGRYMHESVFTLLRSPAPLVSIHDSVYDQILSSDNSVQVLPDIDSIADGLLQTIMEPLLSLALGTQGQQLIADHFSLSSFKHKIRMIYHELLKR